MPPRAVPEELLRLLCGLPADAGGLLCYIGDVFPHPQVSIADAKEFLGHEDARTGISLIDEFTLVVFLTGVNAADHIGDASEFHGIDRGGKLCDLEIAQQDLRL